MLADRRESPDFAFRIQKAEFVLWGSCVAQTPQVAAMARVRGMTRAGGRWAWPNAGSLHHGHAGIAGKRLARIIFSERSPLDRLLYCAAHLHAPPSEQRADVG